jgi:hypothetical protein
LLISKHGAGRRAAVDEIAQLTRINGGIIEQKQSDLYLCNMGAAGAVRYMGGINRSSSLELRIVAK